MIGETANWIRRTIGLALILLFGPAPVLSLLALSDEPQCQMACCSSTPKETFWVPRTATNAEKEEDKRISRELRAQHLGYQEKHRDVNAKKPAKIPGWSIEGESIKYKNHRAEDEKKYACDAFRAINAALKQRISEGLQEGGEYEQDKGACVTGGGTV